LVVFRRLLAALTATIVIITADWPAARRAPARKHRPFARDRGESERWLG
jgi:hypothetical protein